MPGMPPEQPTRTPRGCEHVQPCTLMNIFDIKAVISLEHCKLQYDMLLMSEIISQSIVSNLHKAEQHKRVHQMDKPKYPIGMKPPGSNTHAWPDR